MTISTSAARKALAYVLGTPKTGRLKHRENRSDFGGADSHLLKLRRIGRDYPFGNDVRDGDFGIYLGVHDAAYLVAIQAVLPPAIIGYEQFATLADLKANWELD